MPRTRAQQNRAIRQEALREQLAKQKHIEHVLEMVGKVAELSQEIDAHELNRLKVAIDTKLKLINKYLPDVKSVEMTAEVTDGRDKSEVIEEIAGLLSGSAVGVPKQPDSGELH